MYLNKLFDLIDIIKNKFKKKSLNQDFDEYLNSETPGQIDDIDKYANGIHTDEQFEKLRKNL